MKNLFKTDLSAERKNLPIFQNVDDKYVSKYGVEHSKSNYSAKLKEW